MSEFGSEAQELMRRARQGTPPLSSEVRSRLRESLVSAGSTTLASATFAKFAVVAVVSAGLGSAVTSVALRPNPPMVSPVQPVNVEASPAPLASYEPPRNSTSAISAEPGPSPLRWRPARPTPSTPSPQVESPSVAPQRSADDTSLAAELETIEGILRTTDEGHWKEAQLRLGAYRARFAKGLLRTEASALEVLTLCGEGEVDAARSLARVLREQEPMNPAVLRLERSCAREAPSVLPGQ